MLDIFKAAEVADGVAAINESAELILAGKRAGQTIRQGPAAAVIDHRDSAIMVAVHPEHRGQGYGSALLAELSELFPEYPFWSFGTLPAAQALAAQYGLIPIRELLNMSRSLRDIPSAEESFDHFRPGDEEAILRVNSLAFAHHPEQGKMTLEELQLLMSQDWFDPRCLLVARQKNEIVGFHWTKRQGNGVGEVYVLAVDPSQAGCGIGRRLLSAGLSLLREMGEEEVKLYVEADQTRVVAMYSAAGFSVIAKDTSYGRKS